MWPPGEDVDRTGVDEAAHAGGERRVDEVRGAVDVDALEGGDVREPLLRQAGGVVDDFAAVDAAAQRGRVEHVAGDDLTGARQHAARLLRRSHQGAHLAPIGHERAREVVAQESGTSGQ